jgi:hypothetical protein
MSPIEQWMVNNEIASVRHVGAPEKAESPYKVLVERHLPWLKGGEKEKVPINDPSSRGYTFTLSKLVATPNLKQSPKRSQITLQYFTPPRSNKEPGVEDMICELQVEFGRVGKINGKENASMPQPFLGTMLILQAWLTADLFLELMGL